jgi:hypothetical protein
VKVDTPPDSGGTALVEVFSMVKVMLPVGMGWPGLPVTTTSQVAVAPGAIGAGWVYRATPPTGLYRLKRMVPAE